MDTQPQLARFLTEKHVTAAFVKNSTRIDSVLY